MKTIEQLIIDPKTPIVIKHGEGECGTLTPYTGKRTLRAVKMAETRKACHGDRWAYALIWTGDNWLDLDGQYHTARHPDDLEVSDAGIDKRFEP